MINHYEDRVEFMNNDQNDDIFVPVDSPQLQSIVILLEGPNDRREVAAQYLNSVMDLVTQQRIVDNDA